MTVYETAQALAGNRRPQKTANGFLTWCPAHADDKSPSLHISEKNGKLLVHCFAGCPQEAVIEALKNRGLWPEAKHMWGNKSIGKRRNSETPPSKCPKTRGNRCLTPGETPVKHLKHPNAGLTLTQLAEAKKLPLAFLKGLGLSDLKVKGQPRVVIPYMNQGGEVAAVRYRLSLNGPQRFIWRKGDRVLLYGLWTLAEIRKAGWCLLVEGESDCWVAWHLGLPALGLPGKTTFKPEWAEYFEGVRVFLWQEPDALELPEKLVKHLPGLIVIRPQDGLKDISEAHLAGQDIPALMERLKAQGTPAAVLVRERQEARLKELREAAAPVLAHPDPLELVREAVKNMGYGGDPGPVLITYLATTSRLLAMRPGAMPVHLLLVGQASAGKSFTLQTALRLMPEAAYHEISAGSPRTLIYDDAGLHHRAVVFG